MKHQGPARLRRPILAAISNRRQLSSDDEQACRATVVWAELVAAAGVDLIQIREPGLDDRRLLALVRAVIAGTSAAGTKVLVNQRTDIAVLADAAGVHLPASAPAASRVRRLAPTGFLVGRSVHDVDEARRAVDDGGCDYLIVGTVFPSRSKPADHPIAGTELLAAVSACTSVPVLAIGGVTVDRMREIVAAGADGVAAIGMFLEPVERLPPAPALAQLRAIVRELRSAFDQRPDG